MACEASLRRAGKEKRLVIAQGGDAEVNAGLVKLMRDALAVRNSLLSGSDESIEAIESGDGGFALGVLWHPEEDATDAIIPALISRADG